MSGLSRAPRDGTWLRSGSPCEAGPGAYAMSPQRFDGQRNSHAPFGSSLPRITKEKPNEWVTPGPSSYAPVSASEPVGRSAHIAVSGPRLHIDSVLCKDQTPGPGAYIPLHTKAPARQNPPDTSKEKTNVRWEKRGNPPSIPTSDTQGYIEQDGKWVKLARIAPPPADPKGNSVRQKKRGAVLNTRGAQHATFEVSKQTAELPGPGSYHVDAAASQGVCSFDDVPEHSSAFKSNAKRTPWAPQPNNPGPGYYESQTAAPPATHPHLHTAQAFGACVVSTRPLPRQVPCRAEGRLDPLRERPPSSTGQAKLAPGLSKAPRFPQIKSEVPGPGTYGKEGGAGGGVGGGAVVPFSKGVFGTTTARFPPKKEEQPVGPGQYDTFHAVPNVRSKEKRNAVFIRPKPPRPVNPAALTVKLRSQGVVDEQGAAQRVGGGAAAAAPAAHSSFATDTRFRHTSRQMALDAAVPGPGDYNPAVPQPPKFAFASNPRFPKISAQGPTATSYVIPQQAVPRTFNVTL